MNDRKQLDHIHLEVMSAISKIAELGEQVSAETGVIIQPYGLTGTVGKCLQEGARALPEEFHADHWDLVEKAFKRLKADPPCRRKDECCRALLDKLI